MPDITSNQWGPDAGNDFSSSWWNVKQFGPPCEAFVTLTALNTVEVFRLYIRLQNPGTATFSGYCLDVSWFPGSELYVSKDVSGVHSGLDPVMSTVPWQVGDRIGIRAEGTRISAFKNGVFLGSRTDSSITAGGYAGLWSQGDATIRVDDFGAGTYLPIRSPQLDHDFSR